MKRNVGWRAAAAGSAGLVLLAAALSGCGTSATHRGSTVVVEAREDPPAQAGGSAGADAENAPADLELEVTGTRLVESPAHGHVLRVDYHAKNIGSSDLFTSSIYLRASADQAGKRLYTSDYAALDGEKPNNDAYIPGADFDGYFYLYLSNATDPVYLRVPAAPKGAAGGDAVDMTIDPAGH